MSTMVAFLLLVQSLSLSLSCFISFLPLLFSLLHIDNGYMNINDNDDDGGGNKKENDDDETMIMMVYQMIMLMIK